MCNVQDKTRSWNLAWSVLQPIVAVIIGLGIGLVVIALAGEPHAAEYLWKSAFGNMSNLGMTIFYAVPLVFTGFSVAIAMHAGLFNIGAQGQLIAGCLAGAAVGALFPHVPPILAPILGATVAFLAAGLWGGIPGWLRAHVGSHEVITTIMLNFVAAGLSSWVTLYLLKNPDSQSPETRNVGEAFMLQPLQWNGQPLFGSAPLTAAIFLPLVVAVLVWLFLYRTSLGFELRAVGQNELAARGAGISPEKIKVVAMMLAGGMAGLVAVSEIFGHAGKFKTGIFDYGFMGIAVALLGRCQPAGVVLAAFLFGALHNGSIGLEFESEKVTQEVSMLLRAIVILSVSADGLWLWMKRKALKPILSGKGA